MIGIRLGLNFRLCIKKLSMIGLIINVMPTRSCWTTGWSRNLRPIYSHGATEAIGETNPPSSHNIEYCILLW